MAEVWPLVEPHLLDDLQHITKYRGFLLAAAAQFPAPPHSVVERSSTAWQQLAAAEPPMLPCPELDGTASSSGAAADPMQRLLQLAAARGGGLVDPMAVDGEAAGAAAAPEDGAPGGLSEEEGEQFVAVTCSLFYLLSVLQDAEASQGWLFMWHLVGCMFRQLRAVLCEHWRPVSLHLQVIYCRLMFARPSACASCLQDSSTRSLLGEGAEGSLEAQLQAVKWDVALCPSRSASWERLVADYHTAADDLLVRCTCLRAVAA